MVARVVSGLVAVVVTASTMVVGSIVVVVSGVAVVGSVVVVVGLVVVVVVDGGKLSSVSAVAAGRDGGGAEWVSATICPLSAGVAVVVVSRIGDKTAPTVVGVARSGVGTLRLGIWVAGVSMGWLSHHVSTPMRVRAPPLSIMVACWRRSLVILVLGGWGVVVVWWWFT